MIHNGRYSRPDTLLQILKLTDPNPKSEKNAPSLAAVAESGDLGSLHAVLAFNTNIADTPDTIFKWALGKGRGNFVQVFLEQPELKRNGKSHPAP